MKYLVTDRQGKIYRTDNPEFAESVFHSLRGAGYRPKLKIVTRDPKTDLTRKLSYRSYLREFKL